MHEENLEYLSRLEQSILELASEINHLKQVIEINKNSLENTKSRLNSLNKILENKNILQEDEMEDLTQMYSEMDHQNYELVEEFDKKTKH